MKKKYVAVMLGLALTVSSISAFASEGTTEVSTEDATEQASEASVEEATTTVYGQVTEITSDSITITKGTIVEDAEADTENTEEETEAAADGTEESTEAAADSTEENTEAAADDSEENTEAAADDTENAAESSEDTQESMTLELSTETATYKFAPDAVITELADTENITAEDAAEGSTEASSEADTDVSDAATGETEEAADIEVTEENGEAADDLIEITTEDILAGDIVALEVNESGEVTSLTILAYGTGSYVDTTEAQTDLAEEALLEEEAATEEAAE